jgi:hypothetical protein
MVFQHHPSPDHFDNETVIMADKAPISIPEIRQLVRADLEAGKLYWLPRPSGGMRGRGAAIFNSRQANKEAASLDRHGYLKLTIKGKAFFAHRVIWALAYGEWPSMALDHINGDKSDNRLDNLRLASVIENGRNQSLSAVSTSGVTGVCRDRKPGQWQAYIRSGGRKIHLGTFTSIDEAREARQLASNDFGYHPNHGRAKA